MVSQGYRDWLNAGKPYTLIRPAAAVQTTLRGHGLTVYDYPNQAHLQANTPEDHTPFSATSWPIKNARWRGHALDVMPRTGVPDAQAVAENADIARQLIRDRDAEVPGAMWIKYVNWTDERGVCQQVRWEGGRTERASTDKGHIHISGRSDCATDDRADDYDPIARMGGAGADVNLSDKNPFGSTPKQFTVEPGVEAGPWLGGTVGAQLQYIREDGHFARALVRGLTAKVEALTQVIQLLGDIVKVGGGAVDTAAILAGVDERLAKLAEEQRDAVGDLGEGGAAQVRGPQG